MSVNPTIHPDSVTAATVPACWLLNLGKDGVQLTQTYALARVVVREAAERWPGWWDAELFGPPHREADVALLTELREGLQRLKLVRRRGRRLYATPRGRELADNPIALLRLLATDLGANDPFTNAMADAVMEALAAQSFQHRDGLVAAALARTHREQWHDSNGDPPSKRDVELTVSEVFRRGETYGLIELHLDPKGSRLRSDRISLSQGTKFLASPDPRGLEGVDVFVFGADLLNAPSVGARLAVRADQHLSALHDAIQDAFGWYDDHLYSFWLDGTFWSDKRVEVTTPDAPDEGIRTADLPIAELDLAIGAKVAYVFDFGDEWRVLLTFCGSSQSDTGAYPRVLDRKGTPPPQYPALDDD